MSKLVFASEAEAIERLRGADHAYVSKQFAVAVARGLGIKSEPQVKVEVDTRWMFKGLTLNKPDGYLDLHEFRKWVKENWDWVKPPYKRVAMTWLVDELWMAFTKPRSKGGEGLRGVPYAEGIEANVLAVWACRELGVGYTPMLGVGSELRECCRALAEHFGIGVQA